LRGYIASTQGFWGFWGVNAYYDYRQTHHKKYNQVGLGLEYLSLHWDYRINGYLPVGSTKSRIYGAKFDKFQGNNFYIKYKHEFAMPGVDAEAAYHWLPMKDLDITAAVGPYYFHGDYDKFAVGGKARAKIEYLSAISIEGIASYDNLFKWIGQGQIALTIPLGPKMKDRKIAPSSCNNASFLGRRLVQPVERAEIIVASHHRSSSLAIDPATGLPWNIIFVNNTSHSNGTIESPYPTLLQAQNASKPSDIIYVFTGDGTSTGMNAGITLQNNQQLLGSSINHKITTPRGTLTIPAQTSVLPLITNSGGTVVTLASSNTVSGFKIGTSTTGISGTNVYGTTIVNNYFATATTGNNIDLSDVNGPITIVDNTFTKINSINAVGILTINTDSSPTMFIGNNTFIISAGAGIEIDTMQLSSVNLNIFNNTFTGTLPTPGSAAIIIETQDSSTITGTITGNTLTNFDEGIQILAATSSTPTTLTIQGNNFTIGTGATAVELATAGINPIVNLTITGNTISGGTDGGIDLSPNQGTITALISNNVISSDQGVPFGGGITINVAGSDVTLLATILNNTLLNNSSGVNNMVISSTAMTCFDIEGNYSNTGYSLSTALGGVINIVQGFQTSNSPPNSFTTSGNINSVPSCP
jgi:hypothetical protein